MSTTVDSVFATPAQFILGQTLTGSWQTVYDSSGAITSVAKVNLTLTVNGQTYGIASLSIVTALPTASGGDYVLSGATSDGQHQLQLDWAGSSETPTALANTNAGGLWGTEVDGFPLAYAGVIQSTIETPAPAVWTGAYYLGGWETAQNWASHAVPSASDTVLFDGGKFAFAPSLESAVAVQSVAIDNGAVLTLLNGALTTTGGGSVGVSLDGASRIVGFGKVDASLGVGGAGTIEANGGKLEIDGAVLGGLKLQIDANATLDLTGSLENAAGAAPSVTFNGAAATLDLSMIAPAQLALASIVNFDATDTILLQAEGANDQLSYDASTGKLTVDDGATSETFQLGYTDGTTVTADSFHLSEANGVDTVTICFMAGTMIATPQGEVAVETLQRGDLVLTAEGFAAPVRWLGRQTIASRFVDPVRNWPVRVKAGALAPNRPCRDLLLSPDHALLVDGVLIHAGALVNGSSIARETSVPQTFVYYHVELDDHALILAENTPAETFIDNVERRAFDNWAEHEALYPEGKPMAEMTLPRAKARRQVPQNQRAALDARAALIATREFAAA